MNPNIFQQGVRINSFAAFIDDLIYRGAANRLQGLREFGVVLGRTTTAARLGYSLRTISRAVTRGIELGYFKRAPQHQDPKRGIYGPQFLIFTRKAWILISAKVKELRQRSSTRGTKMSHYPSSLRRKRRGRGVGVGKTEEEKTKAGNEGKASSIKDLSALRQRLEAERRQRNLRSRSA